MSHAPVASQIAAVFANPLGAQGMALFGKATEPPTLPTINQPPKIDPTIAEQQALNEQAQARGRSATLFSGPTGAPTTSAPTYSASRTLLGN